MKNKKAQSVICTVNIGKKRNIVAFFACVFIIFAFFASYFHLVVTPLLVRTSEAQMKILANKSMDYAITEAMSSFVTYDDIIKINRAESGEILAMSANSVKVNNISRMVTQIALSKLVELGKDPLEINLGAFTGINALSGVGPKVKFDVFPYPDITCRFLSKFNQAGINQTLHKIYIIVNAIVRVVFPGKTVEVSSMSDVLICEGVIIGEIPETYLNSNTLTEMLNLVP
ncbi:MAG: sporulation protein YunB [Clostridia bacterium]|nr:sporulation protein YunB [Clostridia bacterium]